MLSGTFSHAVLVIWVNIFDPTTYRQLGFTSRAKHLYWFTVGLFIALDYVNGYFLTVKLMFTTV